MTVRSWLFRLSGSRKISWPDKQVHVDMTRQAVTDAPHFYDHAQRDRPGKRQA